MLFGSLINRNLVKEYFSVVLLSLTTILSVEESTVKILIVDSQSGSPYQDVRESFLSELERNGYTKENKFEYEYYLLSHYPGMAKNVWQH